MSERLKYVDISKGVAIFLMVLGHTHQYNNWDVLPNEGSLTRWIYCFHMPFFFFIAGFTFKFKVLDSKKDWMEWLERIVQRYFVPYMFMMLLSDGFSFEKLKDYLYVEMWRLCKYTPLASWWLPCFIISLLLAQHIVQVFKSQQICSVVLMMFFPLGLWFNGGRVGNQLYFWNVAVMGVSFLGFGMFARHLISCIGYFVKKHFSERGFLVGLLLLTILVFLLLTFTYKMNTTVYMVLGQYGNPFLFVVNALLGAGMLIMIGRLIENAPPPTLVKYFGKVFYHCYDVSSLVYFVGQQAGV